MQTSGKGGSMEIFPSNDSGFGPETRVTAKKSELQPESQSGPDTLVESPRKGARLEKAP